MENHEQAFRKMMEQIQARPLLVERLMTALDNMGTNEDGYIFPSLEEAGAVIAILHEAHHYPDGLDEFDEDIGNGTRAGFEERVDENADTVPITIVADVTLLSIPTE